MQTHFQSFILTMGSASVHVLVERANKRLSENLETAGRKQGGILDAHLPFMGDANFHQQLSMPLSKFFFLTLSPFFSVIVIYHLLKPISSFCFPPVCALGSLSFSPVQMGGKGMLLLPTLAAGRDPLPRIRQVEQMRSTGTVVSTGGFPQ